MLGAGPRTQVPNVFSADSVQTPFPMRGARPQGLGTCLYPSPPPPTPLVSNCLRGGGGGVACLAAILFRITALFLPVLSQGCQG